MTTISLPHCGECVPPRAIDTRPMHIPIDHREKFLPFTALPHEQPHDTRTHKRQSPVAHIQSIESWTKNKKWKMSIATNCLSLAHFEHRALPYHLELRYQSQCMTEADMVWLSVWKYSVCARACAYRRLRSMIKQWVARACANKTGRKTHDFVLHQTTMGTKS